MWIMLNNAFLSIVSPRPDSPTLDVRARAKGDIERVFPEAKAYAKAGRDYAFRAHLPRERVAEAIALQVAGIAYPNFKGSTKENDRHDAYLRCWHAMADFQAKRGHGRPYQTTDSGKARKGPQRRLPGLDDYDAGAFGRFDRGDMLDDLPIERDSPYARRNRR